jgi:DNA modification methylase
MSFKVLGGDCREVMADLEANSVDAIVCDPPYGLGEPPDPRALLTDWLAEAKHEPGSKSGFMGHDWDRSVPGPEVWVECHRVLKPGGHLVAFAGSRTIDLMGLAIRLAGFEIRDSLCWLYGQGFPKGQDLGRAVDRHFGAEREVTGPNKWGSLVGTVGNINTYGDASRAPETLPATPEGERWSGWSTQLKPAHEPIVLARKQPDGSVAANLLAHGVGGYNIDACRLPVHPDDPVNDAVWTSRPSAFREGTAGFVTSHEAGDQQAAKPDGGRYPANLVLDEEAAALLDDTVGDLPAGTAVKRNLPPEGAKQHLGIKSPTQQGADIGFGDVGGPSRFFYTSKATRAEREAGLPAAEGASASNNHPTVKPIDLMRWLTKLVTPPRGRVLDPFCGSGTTGIGAVLEGFDFTGIEQSEHFQQIATRRLEWWNGREGVTIEILQRARLIEREVEERRDAGQLGLDL